jgi:hypothetical protein
MSSERPSSLSEYNKEMDPKMSNRTSTKTGGCRIYGDTSAEDGYAQLQLVSRCVKTRLQFLFVRVKSIYAMINRYGPTCFSCFLAALGDHDIVFDLRVSTCEASFGFNNRYLFFWEHAPREHPALIQPTGRYAGGR